MHRLLAILCLLLAGAVQAELYRQVDEQGNVTFTDVPPREGAQPIELPPTNRMAPPAAPVLRAGDASRGDAEAVTQPRVKITAPAQDATLRANNGLISVELAIEPALGQGQVVRVLLDGGEVARGRQSAFQIENVDRGSHQLRVEIVDAAGKRLGGSESVTFHLQRYSILHRN